MKKRYIVLGVVGFGIFYVSRPWLPMLYLWGNSIEVEINTPAHLVPSVGGSYTSSLCQSLSMSSGNWIDGRRGEDAKLEKISDTQYRAKVYYQDFGPCNWQLDSVGWRLEYKNAGAVLTGAAGGSGGGNTIMIGTDAYFDQSEKESKRYSNAEVMLIERKLYPYILSKAIRDTKRIYLGGPTWEHSESPYYYNPYKHYDTAKIIYNVTVDESSLKGLTADEAYRIQEERLAREKKEKIEKEAAENQRIQAIIDENRRQREEREALEAKNQLSK
ncbi:hypothetical protein GBN23_02415 [Plesiomonas shigelloides]|uniref:hypothetical protein n=1 Tax=Plesiomonas shigelloides TaxID=703 RepID=UPI00126189F8|nr:hypothetical protein [Plesiomonas shigelloides]KAB7684634.1 hypothetical protein GBN23_02415 [Plesiomonas shigelloides]